MPAEAKSCLDVTVLLGGPSSEREVSLVSGKAVAEALRASGHRITEADITPGDVSALDREGIDVVFIALHGAFGEDGGVQRLCEERKLPYVGSGPDASALAMDKDLSKRAFRDAGILTADWVVISVEDSRERMTKLLATVPPPCVVKAIDAGSSVDVYVAQDAAARDDAVPRVLTGYGRAMVEAFIPGRELTVGFLGEDPLPLVEIRPKRAFYDYAAKYEVDDTDYVCNPELPAGVAERLASDALKAYRALECRDLCRIDFILTPDGRAYALEANTLPGFTSHSLTPKAAAAAGIGFVELCDRLIRMAADRDRR